MSLSAAAVEDNPPALACYAAAEDTGAVVIAGLAHLVVQSTISICEEARTVVYVIAILDTSQTTYARLICGRGTGRGGCYMLCMYLW
jgi:hypothetical protein